MDEHEADLSRTPREPRTAGVPAGPQRITVNLNRTAVVAIDR
ncbi:MAG: hypothetical protein P8Y78_15235 [Acidihalobacter sp.]